MRRSSANGSRTPCPRCEQQGGYGGYLQPIRITPWDRDVFLCDECEAMWLEESPVSATGFQDFSTFLERESFEAIRKDSAPIEAGRPFERNWSDYTVERLYPAPPRAEFRYRVGDRVRIVSTMLGKTGAAGRMAEIRGWTGDETTGWRYVIHAGRYGIVWPMEEWELEGPIRPRERRI
jgi:hypothetical protein